MRKLTAGIISRLIFYPYCLVGDHPLQDDEKFVCEDCLSGMPVNREPHRPSNWEPSAESPLREVWSYWEFSEDFQVLAHSFKYKKMPSLAEKLGKYAAGQMNAYIFPPIDLCMPVPLHKTRLRERGYNQAEKIASGFAAQKDLPLFTKILKRVQYTKTQTKLNRDERRANLQSAFTVRDHSDISLLSKNILLIDDVFTTGVTMETSAQVLKEAGAHNIYGFTLATAKLRHHMESTI